MRPPTLGRIDQSAWSVLTRQTAHKGVLLCGYCSYLVALLVGYRQPATEYELSIYAQTATPVWIAIGLALIGSVAVALVAARRETTAAATLLGVLSVITVAALPLVRGYTFYGSGDALTHLGWTREFAAGARGVTSLIYPASHLSSVGLARVTGTSIQRAMLVVVVLTAVLYVVFVLLTVWLLDIDHRGVALAGFSGLMLLPLTNVATHLQFHPYTMTVFLVPLVCYLLVRYVPMPPPARRLFGTGSPAGVLLALVLVSIILFHPQPAVNVLIVLVSVALLQRYRRRKLPAGAAEQLRSVAPMALFFGLALFLWVLPHEKFYALLFGLVDSMIEAVEGTETVGQNVKQRGGSLQDVGVSLQEMFLRLFLVQAVYVGLTVVVVLTNVLGTVRESRPTTSTTVSYLFVGGVALLPFFLFHFVGDISSFFFRHIGFGMVLVTIIGALGFSLFLSAVEQHRLQPLFHTGLGVVLLLLLVLSIVTMFPSPFLLKANQHVTEPQLTGHERAFETAAPGVQFAGIRTGPSRYVDAHRAAERFEAGDVLSPVVFAAGNLTTHYREPRYIVVSTADRQREVRSFRGLRYSKAGFERLGRYVGVSRIRTNGALTLYYVQPRSADERRPVESDPCLFPDQEAALPLGRPRCRASVLATVGPAAFDRPALGPGWRNTSRKTANDSFEGNRTRAVSERCQSDCPPRSNNSSSARNARQNGTTRSQGLPTASEHSGRLTRELEYRRS